MTVGDQVYFAIKEHCAESTASKSLDESLVLPEGGVLKRIELREPWVVPLPTPTRTFFWFNQGMRSFQGPVTLPEQI